MQESYCRYCGGGSAEGEPQYLVRTDVTPPDPRPGQPCRCNELDDRSVDKQPTENKTGRLMTTDQLSAESETPDRRRETDRRLSDRRVLRRVLQVGQRSADDQRVSDRRTDD